ncbi:MAG TPA: hypothetical protein VH641_19785 [Streptosporangiaceae bacterium]|jgi:hypothetical protein
MLVNPGLPQGSASARRAANPRWPLSSALLAAYTGGAAVTLAAIAAGATRHPAAALVAYGVLTGVLCLGSRPLLMPAIAIISWLFDDGFIVGRHADLAWHGAADVRRLAILLAAAAAGSTAGALLRRRHPPGTGQARGEDRSHPLRAA